MIELPLPTSLLSGIAAIVLAMIGSYWSGKIDLKGTLAGGIIAFCLFIGGGFPILGSLFLFFTIGTTASSWRYDQKKKKGLAEKNQGKRSYQNAIANAGTAAICGLTAYFFPENTFLWYALLGASLASATSDTVSSEIGNMWGSKFIDVISLKQGVRGQDGIISLEGSIAGAIGSFCIAAYMAWAVHSWEILVPIGLSGVIGNLSDSLLGATLQRNGWMTNHTVNFANTLIAPL